MRMRIKEHRRVRAGDLAVHELNPRTHSPAQRQALALLLDEIGFARSLLAYELPDGRLKLIDGHLRREMLPEEEVVVEVLDVDDAEARALLLAIDPLAQLAGYDAAVLEELRWLAERDSAAVRTLWETLQEAAARTRKDLAETEAAPELAEQYLIVVECRDEAQQIDLLERFEAEGLRCSAKVV